MRGVGFVIHHLTNLLTPLVGFVPERVGLAEWERRFRSGDYDRLASASERARYSLIAGHCDALDVRSVLDVGCGQGVLADRLKRVAYRRYVGFDLSEMAIDQARRTVPDARNTYLVSDANTFEAEERFDLLVFNECLYHFEDPAAVVGRHLKFLAPGGHVSISMYDTIRSRAVWSLLDMLAAVDAVKVSCEGHASWTVKLMAPATAPGAGRQT
jgi:2-polyprenyl-3-methyl-5-hydroxy-6-metoxy-1,4-benzoquinol methylase